MNERQERFVAEYLVDLNATQAAIRAGYSRKTAGSQGQRLLKNVETARAIAAANERRKHEVQITAGEVLNELRRIGLADLSQAFDANGALRPLDQIPLDVRQSIAGVDIDELSEGRGDAKEIVGQTKKVRFHDKLKALELLGKHLRLFRDVVEHDVTDAMADRFARARQRAEANGDDRKP